MAAVRRSGEEERLHAPRAAGRSLPAALGRFDAFRCQLARIEVVADLGEEVDLARAVFLFGRFALHLVVGLHGDEHAGGDAQELDHLGDEAADEDGPAVIDGPAQVVDALCITPVDGDVVEVRLAEDRRDDLHQDVIDERVDHQPERGAEYHGHGEVDDVAFVDEFLEFVEHAALLSVNDPVTRTLPAAK